MSYVDKITNYFISAYSNSSKYRSSTLAYLRIWFERNNKFKSIVSPFGTVFRNSKWSDLKVSNIKESHLISFSWVVAGLIFVLFLRLEASGLENSSILKLPILGYWVEVLYCWYWIVFGELQYYVFTCYMTIQIAFTLVVTFLSNKLSKDFYGEVINPKMPKLVPSTAISSETTELRLQLKKRLLKRANSSPLSLANNATNSQPWNNRYNLFHSTPSASDTILSIEDQSSRLVSSIQPDLTTERPKTNSLLNTQSRFLASCDHPKAYNLLLNQSHVTILESYYLLTEKGSTPFLQTAELQNLINLPLMSNLQLNAYQLSQINKLNSEFAPLAMNTSTLLNLAKQDRWLLRNSTLSEGLAKSNNAFTQAKKLLGSASSNSDLSIGSIWSSTQLSKLPTLKSTKLAKGLNSNFMSTDALNIAKQTQMTNYFNAAPAANFNFFEESRSWTTKKYYFTSSLFSNTYASAASPKKLTETPLNTSTVNDHFTVLISASGLNTPSVLGQLNITLAASQNTNSLRNATTLQSKLILAEGDMLLGTNLDFLETLTSSTSTSGQLTHYSQISRNLVDVKNIDIKF